MSQSLPLTREPVRTKWLWGASEGCSGFQPHITSTLPLDTCQVILTFVWTVSLDYIFQVIYRHYSLSLHTHLCGFICPHSLCIFFFTGSRGGHPPTRSHSDVAVGTVETVSANNLSECLDKEVLFNRGNTFEASTNKTYLAQRSAYFYFCVKMGISPVP